MNICEIKKDFYVYFIPNKEVDVVFIELIVDTGNIYEDEKTFGLSHVLEHVLFTNEICDQLFQRGIIYNGITDMNYVKYYFYLNKKYTNYVLNIILKFLNFDKLDEKHFDREIKVIEEELSQDLDDPKTILENKHCKNIFGDHILSKKVEEQIENVKNCKFNDITRLYKNEYKINKCSLLISGNYKKNKIIKKLKKGIKNNKIGENNYMKVVKRGEYPIYDFIKNDKMDKCYCKITFVDDIKKKDKYVAEFTSKLLKNVLFSKLRKKSLVYGIHIQFEMLTHICLLNIEYNSKCKHFRKVRDIILKEIEEMEVYIYDKYYKMTIENINMDKVINEKKIDIMENAFFYDNIIINDHEYININEYYKKMLKVKKSDVMRYIRNNMKEMVITSMGKHD